MRKIDLKDKGKSVYEVYFNDINLGEFFRDLDGEYYYWPNYELKGAWSSNSLKLIAQKLDEVNKNEV